MDSPKEIVRKGYNNLSDKYRKHFSLTHNNEYKTWVSDLLTSIPKNNYILELGCGDGIPVARMVSKDHKYLGIDISSVQTVNAKKNVPAGTFITADMTQLAYRPNSFGGIIALYSIIHIPLEEQEKMLKNIHQWLQPKGLFMCTVGATEWTGIENDWIVSGITMYWSHLDSETYSSWFDDIGFSVLKKEFIPEQKGGHVFFLLQKNDSRQEL